jgi:hypothetical protein
VAANTYYTLLHSGSGSITLSGAYSGTTTSGTALTFLTTGTSLTLTVTGSVLTAQLNQGEKPCTYVATTASAVNNNIVESYAGTPITLSSPTVGLLIEQAATNGLNYSRDLTNAAWTKTNMTTALTATGIDNVANSATTLTATAGNATVLQSYTQASSTVAQSAFVKRVTGSGTINMTTDGGTTWNTITVTSNWTLVQFSQAAVTNPNCGFRIVTNGDAISVDFVQNEVGTFATSPILTTSAAATRNLDVLTYPKANVPQYNATINTWQAEFVPGANVGTLAAARVIGQDASNVAPIYYTGNGAVATYDGTHALSTGNSVTNGAIQKAAVSITASSRGLSLNAGTVVTDAYTNASPTTNFEIGNNAGNANSLNGLMRKRRYWPVAASASQLQTITAAGY